MVSFGLLSLLGIIVSVIYAIRASRLQLSRLRMDDAAHRTFADPRVQATYNKGQAQLRHLDELRKGEHDLAMADLQSQAPNIEVSKLDR